jgi:hypothetical protein
MFCTRPPGRRDYADSTPILAGTPQVARSGTLVNSGRLAKSSVRLARNVPGQMTIVLISSKTRPTAFGEVYGRLLARGMRPAAVVGHVAGKLSFVLGMLKPSTPYDDAKHRRALGLAVANQETLGPGRRSRECHNRSDTHRTASHAAQQRALRWLRVGVQRPGEVPSETMDQDEVSLLAQRAGLKLNADELADLQAAYQRTQAQLRALHSRLERTEEPATTFQAGGR